MRRQKKDDWGYFVALCAAVSVAELLSGESICCKTQGWSGRCTAAAVLCAAIGGRSKIGGNRKWEIVESWNENRDWVRGYSIGQVIDSISDE